MGEFESQLLEIFRDEAGARIDTFVGTLLAVERGEGAPGTVDALFRHAHTLKGTAGMLGLGEIEAVAHSLEDVLHEARLGSELPTELVAPLLQAADQLRELVLGSRVEDLDVPAVMGHRDDDGSWVGQQPEPVPEPEPVVVPEPEPEPVHSVRVPSDSIDRLLDLIGETIVHRRGATNEQPGTGDHLLDELKHAAIGMRTLPVSTIVAALPRAVRDAAVACGKDVELTMTGTDTQLDRVILEHLTEPLAHLLRNAVAHGVEPPHERVAAGKAARGAVWLHARQRGGFVELTVGDDGRGVAPEALGQVAPGASLIDVLTRPGFTTAPEVSGLAGRGVGLDAVREHVESLRGTLDVTSAPGRGTSFVLRVPLALALLDVLLFERDEHVLCISLASVEQVVPASPLLELGGRHALQVGDDVLPVADVADLLGAHAPAPPDDAPALVVAANGHRLAVVVDRVLDQEEVLVKGLGLLDALDAYLGGTILGDGRIAAILDPAQVVGAAGRIAPLRAAPAAEEAPGAGSAAGAGAAATAPKVLVVEDSFTVREMQRSILEASGYRVATASNGREALERLQTQSDVALVMTDVDMPLMDGFELAEAIRADPRRAGLPIVVLTSRIAIEDSRRGIDIGVDAYLAKHSFDQQSFLSTLAGLLRA